MSWSPFRLSINRRGFRYLNTRAAKGYVRLLKFTGVFFRAYKVVSTTTVCVEILGTEVCKYVDIGIYFMSSCFTLYLSSY